MFHSVIPINDRGDLERLIKSHPQDIEVDGQLYNPDLSDPIPWRGKVSEVKYGKVLKVKHGKTTYFLKKAPDGRFHVL